MTGAIRRGLQIAVIIFVAAVLCLNLYEGNKVKMDGDLVIRKNRILSILDNLLGESGERTAITTFFHGNLWTLNIGGLTVSDPLAVVSYLVKSKRFHLVFFLSAVLPLLLTVIMGRVYCGWICPVNFLLELSDRLKSFLKKKGFPTFDISFPLYTRHVILALGIAAGIITGAEYFQLIYPPRLFSIMLQDIFFGTALSYGVWFIVFIAAFEFLFSKRLWCRNLCPGGTIYSYAGAKALLRVEPVSGGCTKCFECKDICPYQLEPFDGNPGGDCDRCGLCVKACGKKVLGYGFNKSKESIKELKCEGLTN